MQPLPKLQEPTGSYNLHIYKFSQNYFCNFLQFCSNTILKYTPNLKKKEILSKQLDVAEHLHKFLSFDFFTIYTKLQTSE